MLPLDWDKETVRQERLAMYNTFIDAMVRHELEHKSHKDYHDPIKTFIKEQIIKNLAECDPTDEWVDFVKGIVHEQIKALLDEINNVFPFFASSAAVRDDFIAHCSNNVGEDNALARWDLVHDFIMSNYKEHEINVDGYTEQMLSGQPNIVAAALADDWLQVDEEKFRDFVNRECQHGAACVASQVHHGREDFKRYRQLQHTFYSYPELEEIARLMGRSITVSSQERDQLTKRFLPVLISHAHPTIELECVAQGDNLAHMMPIETAILADERTSNLFYMKWATKQLNLFHQDPQVEAVETTVVEKKKDPHSTSGPIIVSIDTSSSMDGQPLDIALSMLLQLHAIAVEQHRACYLISFSVQSDSLDISALKSLQVVDFVSHSFSGGTEANSMLLDAFTTLQSQSYANADVLIISDFEVEQPHNNIVRSMNVQRKQGTRFYGLCIGTEKDFGDLLDRMWYVSCNNFQHIKSMLSPTGRESKIILDNLM